MNIEKKLSKSLPLLAFGLLYSFFSSFGQTFLLSLYVPSIEAFLAIDNTAFGGIYAVATIGSALTLPWLGGWFDRMEIRRYAVLVVIGLAASLLLLSVAAQLFTVVLAFYGLRLFGQGLMSHTSVSAMAKYFTVSRGKAIGFAGLGHPIGEALLPIGVTVLIGAVGWRGSLQLSTLSCILLVIPLGLYLLQRSKVRIRAYAIQVQPTARERKQARLATIIREQRFWVIAPLVFMLGFSNTALFFFQLKLGEARGWSPEWVAGSISAFAIAGAVGMTVAGPLADRFSGRRLFRLFAFPYLLGLACLIFFRNPLAYPLALLCLGLANGAGSTIQNAMLAEIYGIEIIGSVRSIFAMVMVFSTSLGPIAFGLMLDAGWSFSLAFAAVAGVMALAIANGMRKMSG